MSYLCYDIVYDIIYIHMTSYVTSYVFHAAVPESERGCADRHEMLDMDDYEYVPPHAESPDPRHVQDALIQVMLVTQH